MSTHPIRPLRFYEIWMLKLLARSPRIDKIVVVQHVEADPIPPLADKKYVIQHLERSYNLDTNTK
jgi:hypothetical protein